MQMVLLSELYGIKQPLKPENHLKCGQTKLQKGKCKRNTELSTHEDCEVEKSGGAAAGAAGQRDYDHTGIKRTDTHSGSRLKKQKS